MAAVTLRLARQRRQAEEWALVLTAEGLEPHVERVPGGFRVSVADHEVERAEAALAAYEHENRGEATAPAVEPFAYLHEAAAVCLTWIGFFLITGPRDPAAVWFARGSADAARILDGELWRTVTALTLHADWPHVLGNAAAGTLFLTALFQPLGPGVGVLLTLATGALGNALNAWMRETAHVSVGASTAVFGALGLLAGLAVVRRRRGGSRGRRTWAPLAAGLALLSMLGVGERSDLGAHLFGFGVGGVLGLAVASCLRERPGFGMQLAGAALGLGLVVICWLQALA